MPDRLAVYGAVIGSAAAAGALWNIYHGWWLDRPRVSLVVTVGSEVFDSVATERGTISLRPDKYLIVRVVNRGRRPAKINSAGLVMGDKSQCSFTLGPAGMPVFPCILDERTPSVDACADVDRLRNELSKAPERIPTHAFCYDATGKCHVRRLSRQMRRWLSTAPQPEEPADGAAV
jgi:hypothetical protein